MATTPATYGSLPFKQQIAFLRNKQNVLTEQWTDVWEAEHDNAFMVAGANRIDLLADFREAVRAAVEDGETLEQFRARFDTIVATHGWDYNGGRSWRSRVIYETNLRTSYAAGRYQQQMALAGSLPYIRYKHSDSVQHPRPVHLSWNNKIWRADDPVWKVIFPPNGWGCQCYTESLSQRQLEKLGKHGPDPSPQLKWINVEVGTRSPNGPRTVRTVEGVDPGFAYAPGASLDTWPAPTGSAPIVTPPSIQRTLEQSAQGALRKSARLPASAAASMLKDILVLQRAQDALEAGYAEFQAVAIGGDAAASTAATDYMVGALGGDLLDTLAAREIVPATAAVLIPASNVVEGTVAGVAAADLLRIPRVLRVPRAVLWDAATGELLYVGDAGKGLLVLRVQVQQGVPRIDTARIETDPRRLARYPLLQGRL